MTTASVPTPARLLSIKDAARYLSASVWFVRSLIWDKRVPYLQLGKKFCIDRADLDAFVERSKQQ
jgi:excisionase family DNA binding protein